MTLSVGRLRAAHTHVALVNSPSGTRPLELALVTVAVGRHD